MYSLGLGGKAFLLTYVKGVITTFKTKTVVVMLIILAILAGTAWLLLPANRARFDGVPQKPLQGSPPAKEALEKKGREIFRFDTYGDEVYFTDILKLPFSVLINTPAATREKTLGVMTDKDGKIVGIEEVVSKDGKHRWGVTCAFCHSVVNDKGERLDGIPNTRLNVGAILALSPTVDQKTRKQFLSWGPGRVDVTFNNEAEDGVDNPAVMEPAFGTKGIKYFNWNGTFKSAEERSHFTMDVVAHGNGEFKPPARWGIVNKDLGDGIDLIGPKMPAVVAYLKTLDPPAPKPGSFNQDSAAKGQKIFMSKAGCSRCHTPPLYTNNKKVKPDVVGTDPKHADSPVFKDGTYKVPQLRGVWAVGPYFHDGSAKTLLDVVDHYNRQFKLNLSQGEKADLVEFLKSL